jgi:hypothetical protein
MLLQEGAKSGLQMGAKGDLQVESEGGLKHQERSLPTHPEWDVFWLDIMTGNVL